MSILWWCEPSKINESLFVLIMSFTHLRVNPHSILPRCQGTPCSKQVQNLKFKWRKWSWTHNHLVCKWTLNYFVFLYKQSGCGLESSSSQINEHSNFYYKKFIKNNELLIWYFLIVFLSEQTLITNHNCKIVQQHFFLHPTFWNAENYGSISKTFHRNNWKGYIIVSAIGLKPRTT